MYQQSLFILLVLNISLVFARVPPRNIELEENTELKSKNEPRIEELPKVQEFQNGDQSKLNKKPFSLLVLRQPSMIFPPMRPMSPFSPMYHESMHNDPALRLISVLFGGHRLRPEPELIGSDESDVSIESIDQSKRDHFNPFEAIFPSIFSNLKPIDKEDTPKELETDSKSPDNFEKKEKKVIIGHDGKKYVKSTQVKKVKNDFGMFHSVISSYQPWDQKIHDEDGNEKVKPVETEEKPVESSIQKVDESKIASSTVSPKLEVEDEPKSLSPKPDSSNTLKKISPEKLSERNDAKNEISDKKIDEKIEPTVEVNPK